MCAKSCSVVKGWYTLEISCRRSLQPTEMGAGAEVRPEADYLSKFIVNRRMSSNNRREFVGGAAGVTDSEAQKRGEVPCSHTGLD